MYTVGLDRGKNVVKTTENFVINDGEKQISDKSFVASFFLRTVHGSEHFYFGFFFEAISFISFWGSLTMSATSLMGKPLSSM